MLFKAAGSGSDDPAVAFNQHTALSGGTTTAFAGLGNWYKKSGTTIVGTEKWTKTTQSPAVSTLTLTGEGANQGIYVFPLETKAMNVGYSYLSFNVTIGNTAAQLGGYLYLMHDLDVQRSPDQLLAGLF